MAYVVIFCYCCIRLFRGNEQLVLDVLDVQSYGGYVLHTCALSTSSAYSEPGQEAQLEGTLPATILTNGDNSHPHLNLLSCRWNTTHCV